MIKKIYKGIKSFLSILLALLFSYCMGYSIYNDYCKYGLGIIILFFIIGIPLFVGLVTLGELVRNKIAK